MFDPSSDQCPKKMFCKSDLVYFYRDRTAYEIHKPEMV